MERESGFSPGSSSEGRKVEVSQALESVRQHELVEKHRPEILGEGSYQTVFTIERLPGTEEKPRVTERGLVAKVSRSHLEIALRGLRVGAPDDEGKKRRHQLVLKKALRQEEGNASMMEKYFSPYALRERIAVMDVPVSKELFKTLSPLAGNADIPSGILEVPTIVSLQQRAPKEAFEEGSFEVGTSYLDKNPRVLSGSALDEYREINKRFLDNESVENSKGDVPELIVKKGELKQLLERIQEDPRLEVLVKDFLSSTMAFTNETGNVLDLVGSNNSRFYQKGHGEEKEWKLALLDARVPGGLFVKARESLQLIIDGQQPSDEQMKDLIFALAHVRFVNALAQQFELEQRLKIFSKPIASHSEQLIKAFRIYKERQDERKRLLKAAAAK